MSDDADLQYLGQVQTPVPIQPSYGQDVLVEMCVLCLCVKPTWQYLSQCLLIFCNIY